MSIMNLLISTFMLEKQKIYKKLVWEIFMQIGTCSNKEIKFLTFLAKLSFVSESYRIQFSWEPMRTHSAIRTERSD